jgi:hypothetical protein
MSSDPPAQLPPPVPPPGAAADPEPQPAPDAEPPEVMHRTRAVDFLGRRTPIVYQNDNGPCPLLAICELSRSISAVSSSPALVLCDCLRFSFSLCAGNVLLLKNVISLNPDDSEVSQQKLLSLVAERLIDSNTNVQVRFTPFKLLHWTCIQSVCEWFWDVIHRIKTRSTFVTGSRMWLTRLTSFRSLLLASTSM